MKFGIIFAMEAEGSSLCEKMKNFHTTSLGISNFYIGLLKGVEVVLLRSGIGKVCSSIGTTALIERYKPDIIINIGSAGSLISTIQIGTIVIPQEVCYHDVNITAFGYKFGQIPGLPLMFKTDEKLSKVAKLCVSDLKLNAEYGLIVSGDTFVNKSDDLAKIRYNFPKAIAVEMEGAAIAHVCHNFKIPFIVLRVISDMADQQSSLNFNTFLNISMKRSSLITEHLIQRLKY